MHEDPHRSAADSGKAESRQPLELISLIKNSSMPAAWAGEPDKSRLLAWGDFFLIFAVDAPIVAAGFDPGLMKNPPLQYPYSLTAFYHRGRNPHGHPSARPVLSVTIERLTIAGIAAVEGSSSGSTVQPPMLCEFLGDMHINHGVYEGSLDPEAAYAALVEQARPVLGVAGDPTHIGRPSDAYGHPQTGVPKKEASVGAAKSGCLVFLACLSGLGVAAVESLRVLAQ